MVRPEKVQLQTAAADSGLPGRIQSAIYLGESTRWTVLLAAGAQIQVVEQNRQPAGSPAMNPGDEVYVRWEPDSAILL